MEITQTSEKLAQDYLTRKGNERARKLNCRLWFAANVAIIVGIAVTGICLW